MPTHFKWWMLSWFPICFTFLIVIFPFSYWQLLYSHIFSKIFLAYISPLYLYTEHLRLITCSWRIYVFYERHTYIMYIMLTMLPFLYKLTAHHSYVIITDLQTRKNGSSFLVSWISIFFDAYKFYRTFMIVKNNDFQSR